MRLFFTRLLKLFKRLSRWEQGAVIAALLIVVLTAGFWWANLTSDWLIKPVKGGTYIEGIVSNDTQEVDQTIAKLTQIGLTYIDHNNTIRGALADHWEITEDGKKYTFFLRPGVDGQAIANEYSLLPSWRGIEIKSEQPDQIVMNLKQPFGPLLAFASDPVINNGPFTLEKRSKNEIIFNANEKFVLGEPNLQKLILILYPDERSLKAGLQRQEVMGANIAVTGVSGVAPKKLTLTEQNAIFFNLDQPIFKDQAIREKISKGQRLDQPISVTLVTNQDPELLTLANQFAEKVKDLNLTVSIKSLNPIVLERDYIAKDAFDLLLTSVNYGYDPDPYPFWHSSQVLEGKNYAGYNSKDTDKLIEDARQTVDQAERLKKYDAIYAAVENNVPAILYPKQQYQYTVSKRLKGVTEGIAAVPADRFTEVWKWFLKAKKSPN